MINVFKLAFDPSAVGVYPQVGERWPWATDRSGPDSYTMTPLKGHITFNIIFPHFVLEDGAKLTDWVSATNINRNYWMVSTRLMELLKKYHLDEYQYFPAPVHTPTGIVGYHLIYFPWPRQDDFIDWEKSLFKEDNQGISVELKFPESRKYLMENNDNTKMKEAVIFPDKITMDVFRFTNYRSGFYVSERLKNAMEAAGMTGIVYEVPEWLPV